MIKALYRPLGMASSVLGGLLASALFKKIWQKVAHEDEAPKAKDGSYTWRQVVPAAAVQGAVFGGVKAAVDRGGLKGFEKMTGVWAGD